VIGKRPWYQGIREIHDRHFLDSWEARVEAINQLYQLTGEHMLISHGAGVPMPWFNGDIQAVEPGRWVLVISLNHQIDRDGTELPMHQASGTSPEDAWWLQRRRMNLDRWYGHFFGPLARVAATALEEQVAREDESAFATNRMIFVEICPYASNRFNLSWPVIEQLLATDLGFRLASEVNHLLIEKGEPALVMVNGTGAIAMFQHLYAHSLEWREMRYDSCHTAQNGRKQKQLRHYCGSLQLGKKSIPVVGFPFLRTPSTHNSNQEVVLLGDHVSQCVRAQ
jgi:hypothetical protein